MRLRIVSILAFVLFIGKVSAAPPKTGKPWLDMDYGPYLTASIESSNPERNIAQKGIAIKLGKDKTSYVVFDTDLMRYSVGWTGSFLNFKGVAYDGSHGTWPAVTGAQIFGTRLRPGWAKEGSFEDPRKKYEGTGYGPLPRDWAKYRGLYLHNQRVILSYTVGKTKVLDSPGYREEGETGVFNRTLNVGKSSSDLLINVLESAGSLSILNADLKQSLSGADVQNRFVLLGDVQKLADAKPQAPQKTGLPTNGLIAHWTFDEAQGARAASIRKEHVATIKGAAWSKGKKSSALTFGKGQSAIVSNSDAFDLSRDFSIVAWVKTTKNGTVFSKTVEGKWTKYGKSFFVRGGRPGFDVGWVGVVNSQRRVNDGKWHKIALTYRSKNGRARIYVDGKLDGEKRLESMPDPKGSKVRFGYTSTNFPEKGNKSLIGSIDEVRFYNRTLSASELGATATQNLVAVSAKSDGKGLKWKATENGQLQLVIPASSTPTSVVISIAHQEGEGTLTGLNSLTKVLASGEKPINLADLTKGGPPRWKETLTAEAKKGKGDTAYVRDELVPPRQNPWNSWMRFGGFDFFKDGKRAAICTWNGDVWIVTGIDAMEKLTWKRIATGMYQPLGLKIVPNADGKEEIYVCCRDQITRLHDLNNDGEMDYYECFNNDHQVTEHFHEFAMDLQTDSEGNFYYAKSARHAKTAVVPHHGTLIKVSKDGNSTSIICSGFRAANGVGIGPDGELMTSDQEGHWTPANRINLVKKNGFYGNMFSFEGMLRKTEQGYDPPLCWLPKNVDRSPAEQLWVTSNKWGPLEGQMIHLSYGTGNVFLVVHEMVNGVPQGGVVPIPGLKFPTGVMRGRFHPQNGQLYLCGLVGWSSNCAVPGGFYRVRYTDKPANLPVKLTVKPKGIELTFTGELDKKLAEDVDSYSIEQWNYRWTKNYGSKHYQVSNPKRTGQDEVEVISAKLSADGKTVMLEIEELEPVMQMKIALDLKSSKGVTIRHVIHHTINQIPNK